VLNDPSLLLLYERIQRWRLQRRSESGDIASLKERIESLEREVIRLKETIDRMIQERAAAGESENEADGKDRGKG
jgi:cell division protein FtsB